jgi:hypothetical protein
MEILYILMTSSGSYDDYMTHILGIYSTLDLAEEGKVKYKEALDKFFDENPCPIDEETREKIESYEITIDENNDDNSLIDLYQGWSIKTYGVFEMSRDPWITSKIINQTDLKIIEDRTVNI